MFVNTGQEFDGSDSGARPDEAVSWGKIRMDASPVKVRSFVSMLLLFYVDYYKSDVHTANRLLAHDDVVNCAVVFVCRSTLMLL